MALWQLEDPLDSCDFIKGRWSAQTIAGVLQGPPGAIADMEDPARLSRISCVATVLVTHAQIGFAGLLSNPADIFVLHWSRARSTMKADLATGYHRLLTMHGFLSLDPCSCDVLWPQLLAESCGVPVGSLATRGPHWTLATFSEGRLVSGTIAGVR